MMPCLRVLPQKGHPLAPLENILIVLARIRVETRDPQDVG